MRGRYALYGPIKRNREHDRWFDQLETFGTRYNIAPESCVRYLSKSWVERSGVPSFRVMARVTLQL